jgi:hypothetical protein
MSNFPLLPADRYIAEMLGLSEEQYRWYMADVERRAKEGPQPAVVADAGTLALISLISTIISVGLTIAASFFKPKQQQQPRLQQNQTQGQSSVDGRRFTPRNGFDSLQDIATLGEPIPLIYARRETIDGEIYGGVRVNTPMLWSELSAQDKGQYLRALFLIGEGHSGFQIDPENIAIGNNSLGAYLLGTGNHARFSLYFRPNGGRITTSNRIGGTSNDPGILDPNDVYAVINQNGNLTGNFCHTHRPTTQTQFGVYSLIGNGLGYRINPQLRPGVNAQLTVKVKGKKKKAKSFAEVVCEPDFVAKAQRQKQNAKYSGRGGLINATGSNWTYHLSNTTDALTIFSEADNVGQYTTRVEVFENPFADISDSTVAGWASVTSITASTGSVSAVITINTSAVRNALGGTSATDPGRDGTYLVEYGIFFVEGKRDIFTEYSFTVTRSAETNETERTGSTYDFTGSSGTVQVATSDRQEIHEERCGDVASAVAGRQKTWDDALQVGDLYKIGASLALCTSRTPSDRSFNSDADFDPVTPSQGNSLEAVFRVLRNNGASTISINQMVRNAKNSPPPPFYTATNFPHICRVAIANFSTLRECRIVRICLRSALGVRISGLCNFKDSLTYAQIDDKACLDKEGDQIAPGNYLTVDIFSSGQMSSSEERYSFFRVRYREAGNDGAYTEIPRCFGIRGITQQNIYNDIRFVMPSTRRWEFQIEPLSGWEIRSGTATGALELIDSSMTTERDFSDGGVRCQFKGVIGPTGGAFIPSNQRNSLGPQRFRLASAERGSSPEIGIGYSDGSSYIDDWGKLAESFVYEEVRSSAENGPEHEIVAIDEIVTNSTIPNYDSLAIMGFNARSGTEWQQFGQLSVYITRGLASGTHLFPSILQDLLTNERYGKGDQITTELLDIPSFNDSANWCQDRRLFFDGAITGRVNLRQWAADTAAAHLLIFGESGGKFWLKPAWPGTVASPQPVEIRGIFTAGNILEGTFQMEFFEPEDRRPIQVSVKYREERSSTSLTNPGLFPVEREVLVREANFSSETDPIEQIDISAFCTSRRHAIDTGRFICRMRRIPDHAVRFSTTHEGIVSALAPGDFIRVVVDLTQYNQLRNGGVLNNGTLVTTQPFSNGTYTVLAWDGSAGSLPSQTTLTVTDGGTKATPTGIIFTLINSETRARTYQIERITPSESGGFSMEAVHMPTNSSNILELAAGFTTGSNWVIQD